MERLKKVLEAYLQAAVWLAQMLDKIPSRYVVPALMLIGSYGWAGWAHDSERHWWTTLVAVGMGAVGFTLAFGVGILEEVEKEREEHDPLKIMERTKPRFMDW